MSSKRKKRDAEYRKRKAKRERRKEAERAMERAVESGDIKDLARAMGIVLR